MNPGPRESSAAPAAVGAIVGAMLGTTLLVLRGALGAVLGAVLRGATGLKQQSTTDERKAAVMRAGCETYSDKSLGRRWLQDTQALRNPSS